MLKLPHTRALLTPATRPDNLVHCAPPETPEAIFSHIQPGSQFVAAGAWVVIYGAFLQDDGTFASDGDRAVRPISPAGVDAIPADFKGHCSLTLAFAACTSRSACVPCRPSQRSQSATDTI